MDLKAQATKAVERLEEIESLLNSPEIDPVSKRFLELSRTRKAMELQVAKAREYLSVCNDLEEWSRAAQDASDKEMQHLAQVEVLALEPRLAQEEEELKMALIPRDMNDLRDAIMEIRAGTGGDEASLFAGDLYKMYRRYCDNKGWRCTVVDEHEGTMGGYKEIVMEVTGEGAYGILKFESGVHRVQRVPDTETQGRVHTSAATVVVLPQADELDEIVIKDEDLRVDTYRSGGSGGQHINKTDSAVRLTHLPSGIVVACQDERSQHKNKAKAMKLLQSKLLDARLQDVQSKEAAARKSQVGSGDRSAKIRTYNFPQGRVTDHRVNLTLYKLDAVMNGEVDELIDGMRLAEVAEKLKALERQG